MSKKVITDEGKTELLRLGFKSEEAGGAFTFMGLGDDSSKGAQGGAWHEISSSDYHRVQTEVVGTPQDKSITISATFDEANYAPATSDKKVTEIGLFNASSNGQAFMYSEVPKIAKTGDISLQYTIIISID